jgi:ABC-type nitrate/sulfonate/bicarbonate transport system substrate-binding protein
MRAKKIAIVSLLALFFFVGHRASASPQSLSRLRVGYGSPSGNQAVLWVAKEAGSFKRHGLEVDVIFIGSGSTMTQAVIAG